MESTVLVKAFALLEALSAAREPMPLAALAEQCGLAKPTAHRVLNDLAALGYAERVETGVYRLSGKFHRLTSGDAEEQLLAEAVPVLERLHEQTGETVNLGVLRRDRVVYLRVLESRHALRRVADSGSVDPFHCTALGRAIAAQLPRKSWDRLLARVSGAGRTPQSPTDPAQVRALLEKAHADGYAVEVDETDIGVTCVGAPIFDESGVVAAISLSVPSARADAERCREFVGAVCAAAQDVSQRLTTNRKDDQV